MAIELGFHFDEEVDRLLKSASASAKAKDFDAAISKMKEALENMWVSDVTFSPANIAKIIPYFQKAGRYSDGVAFADKYLIPKLVEGYDQAGSTDRAFICRYVGEVHQKLALNAKREKIKDDETFFSSKAAEMQDAYMKLIEIARIEDLKEEYPYMLELFGPDHSKWPDAVLKTFEPILR
ncbi:hypothetical protein HRH59_18260 [Rheinheimera sp. YQF-2]|uniref:Uncharacterized protein n=1 Tax=Rheinheimera lutimaris TaxID=2740584 RepID=A0A7Y5ATX0_9GAMM|nr:hypothetical protein [Rheinheimera lutimaris]NRQ44487.1 hypothetical protein [Rheinheimera lutimaris]